MRGEVEIGGDIFRGGGGWKCVEVGGKLEEVVVCGGRKE